MEVELRDCLFDMYNQFAYVRGDEKDEPEEQILTNAGLSALERCEYTLGFESPIKRKDLWGLWAEERE